MDIIAIALYGVFTSLYVQFFPSDEYALVLNPVIIILDPLHTTDKAASNTEETTGNQVIPSYE